jgi:site-specific DNA recombinase
MMRAIIYARVSTNVQEDNYSFPIQIGACRAYAEQHGMSVVEEFQEVESGGSLRRPMLEKVRDLIRTGLTDVLIVFNLDRLSRNMADMLHLREELRTHNVALHFATRGESGTGATGGLFDNIEAAFAEYERMKIRERLLGGRERKIKGTDDKPARIYGNGNCPYGYSYEGHKKDKRLVINDAEAIVVRNMYFWSLSGWGVLTIAHELNRQGILTSAQAGRAAGNTKREHPIWTGAMVWRMLTNELYAGTMYFGKYHRVGTKDIPVPRDQWIGVPVPAIVDNETFTATKERLSNARKSSKRNAKHFYLLGRGKMKCVCGYTMTGTGHTSWRGYRCTHGNGDRIHACALSHVKGELVEGIVWNWLYSVLTPEAIKAGIEVHEQVNASERETVGQRLVALSKRRGELDREADKMIRAYKADVITMEELAKDKELLDAERKVITQEEARLEALRQDGIWHDAEALMAEAEELRAYMPHMNNDEKAALLDRLYLTVLRKLNDAGEPVVQVECRLGAATLPLRPSTELPGDDEMGDESSEIVSPSYSIPRLPRYATSR